MRTIGNNDFFETVRGAKIAATRRGVVDGAKILDTSEGYCLLNLGEGCNSLSYAALSRGEEVSELRNGKWSA